MTDVRSLVVTTATSAVPHRGQFTYSEGADRMAWLKAPGKLPVSCDCSSFATMVYYMAGAPDPNGLGYDGQGYTGTLLSNRSNVHVMAKDVLPGDLVVYGGGSGEHVAIVTQVTNGDIMTVSMGQQGDPWWCWVNAPKHNDAKGLPVDGRTPQTFLRCLTNQVRPQIVWH